MATRQNDQVWEAEFTLLQPLSSETFSQILFVFSWLVF